MACVLPCALLESNRVARKEDLLAERMEDTMRNRTRVEMVDLEPVSVKPGQVLTVYLNENVKVELRVTPLGQPEIFCDHTHLLRLFKDWYPPNETC